MAKLRIGLLTGGGDAPGLNAVIRAAVRAGERTYDCEMIGIRHGFEGFLEADGVIPLNSELVKDILPKGGTILGAANRGNPFARKIIVDGEEIIQDISDQVVSKISDLGLDALLVAGGDGTLGIARDLYRKGVPIIGIPKTIDNDVGGTEISFGFDTALNIAMEALDRLRTTAESHHRVMLLEVMGRNAGYIALNSGISGGADIILIPEIPFDINKIAENILERKSKGRHYSILIVSEGAVPAGGSQVFSRKGDEITTARLGGISHQIAFELEEACALETRVTVLGHIQRGGTPTAFDRGLATRFGAAAVGLGVIGEFGKMVAYQCEKVIAITLEEALRKNRRVDVNGDAVKSAREIGISFGD